MKPKVKRIRQKATVLHDTSAGFVSIVDRGANEDPFTSIKSFKNGGKKDMKVTKRKDRSAAKKGARRVSGKKTKAEETTETKPSLSHIVFNKSVFETEDQVTEKLESMDFETDGVEITEDGNHFTARLSDTSDDDFESVAPVELSKDQDMEGVVVFVGKLSETSDEDDVEEEDSVDDEDDGEETEDEEETTSSDDTKYESDEDEEEGLQPVAVQEETDTGASGSLLSFSDAKRKRSKKAKVGKSRSKRRSLLAKRADAARRVTVKKFSYWDAYYSKGGALTDILKDGMSDGVPPGYDEVSYALSVAASNILSADYTPDEKETKLSLAASEYASIVSNLDRMFTDILEDPEEVEKALGVEASEKLNKWADRYAMHIEDLQEDPDAASDLAKSGKDSLSSNKKAVDGLLSNVEDRLSEVEGKLGKQAPTSKLLSADECGTADVPDSDDNTDDDKEWMEGKKTAGIFGV